MTTLPSAPLASVAEEARSTAATTLVRGTVISPGFDLLFFVLPPLGTALFLAAQGLFPAAAFALSAMVWVGLAQSHFGATALFYLDPASLRRYRRSPAVYIAAPALLVLGSAVLGLTRFAGLVLLAVPLVSFWHGNKQSVGVCGLYRGLTRSFDATSRRLELLAVFAGSACFTAAGIARLGMFEGLARWVDRLGLVTWLGFPRSRIAATLGLLWWAAFAAALLLLVAAELRALRQCRRGGVSPAPRMIVLATSFLMYSPYLLARDVLSAYLAALIPHYLQYHGLLYLVNRNKVAAGVVPGGGLLAAVVRSPRAYATATIGFALALGSLLVATYAMGRVEIGLAVVAGVNLAHFWLDGFFWRFRDPEARAATLRHIRPLPA